MNNENTSPPGGAGFGNNAQGNIGIGGNVHGNVTINNEAKTESVASLHQIPSSPRDFTGREAEIKELLEMLEHGGVTISGLHGLGGVGKTTLALKLAEALKDKYPDAQFYLDLKGADAKPLPVADALAHVIRAYHPTAKLPESLAELRALYLSVLHNQKALLLMDNARDEQQVEPLIPPSGCLLMVTSRFHFTVPGLKVKNLDALTTADAVKFLLEIAPRIGDQAAEIARLCGNLPLGLRLAASFLSTRANYKVTDYVRKLSEGSKRVELIEASLSLSYELLREELRANWRALAVFPDSFDQLAAAAVWALDEEQTQERLGDLLNFSLVEWSEETDRYRLHDLVRVFADSRLTDSERLTRQRQFGSYYKKLLSEEADLANLQSRLGRLNLADFGEVLLTISHKLDMRLHEAVALLMLSISYRELGDIRRALESNTRCLAIVPELGNRFFEGSVLWNRVLVLNDLGDRAQAVATAEAALLLYKQIAHPKESEVRAKLKEWRSE